MVSTGVIHTCELIHCLTFVIAGATLQMGIGSIPDAVLSALVNHKGLGIHTEMFSDGVMRLIEKGVVTNENKVVHPNLTVAGFVMGTRKLYDFLDGKNCNLFHAFSYFSR